MKDSICATIILYNPDETIFSNIDSYINFITKLIVIDNSEIHNKVIIDKLLNKYVNLEYVNNNDNLGIATALNIACDRAIELGMKWILTMDQDSRFLDFKSFLSCCKNITENVQDIGIIAPNHTGNKNQNFTLNDCSITKEKVVITSGNIVNLKHFNKIGRFDEKLFIDMVDYDFSNKVILNNLQIYLLKNHYIIHHIGQVFQRKNFVTRKIKSKIEHNPQRVYYMTRNRLYLSSIYSKSFPQEYNFLKTLNLLFIHDLTKILLYEDMKLAKIWAKIIAFSHFCSHQYGKYNL